MRSLLHELQIRIQRETTWAPHRDPYIVEAHGVQLPYELIREEIDGKTLSEPELRNEIATACWLYANERERNWGKIIVLSRALEKEMLTQKCLEPFTSIKPRDDLFGPEAKV